MPSAWITTRRTKGGAKRYRVAYRLGGRESQIRYAGTFRTGREATTRKRYVVGELAAMRVPNLTLLEQQAPTSPLLSDACEAWRRSRIDVTDGTRTLHRVALGRVLRTPIATKRLHEITVNDVVGVVAELADAGAKRETIKRSRDCLAMVLDHHHVDPSPARDSRVRLPRTQGAPAAAARRTRRACRRASPPPLRAAAAHPRHLRGARQRACHRPSRRPRRAPPSDPGAPDRREKRPLSPPRVSLPHDLFAALLATLPPREDRAPEAPLFADLDDAALRTAITRACKALGVPRFSPHALRRRRGSLHYHRTGSLVDVATVLGDSKRVAEDHYVYALTDYREVDRTIALARALA